MIVTKQTKKSTNVVRYSRIFDLVNNLDLVKSSLKIAGL